MNKEKIIFPKTLKEYEKVARHPLAKEVYKRRQNIVNRFPFLKEKDGRS